MLKRRDVTDVIPLSNFGLNLIMPKLKNHLMSLSDDDKYKRFYTPANERTINNYLSGITLDSRGDAVFVVYDDKGENVVGMCHVAVSGTKETRRAELALTVSAKHRKRRIGLDMLERAVLHCRTIGITKVFMNCLKSNTPMQNMARKLHMKVVTDIDESVGELELAKGRIPTAMTEALAIDTVAMFDLQYRRMVNVASHILAAAISPIAGRQIKE